MPSDADPFAGPFLALEDAQPAQRAGVTLQGLSTQELRDLIAQVRANQVSEPAPELSAMSPDNPEPRTQNPVPQAKGSVAHRVSAAEAATEGVHQQAALAVAAASTERVSLSSTGGEGDNTVWAPSLSADGRFVAFHGQAANLVPGDTNGRSDVFVYDRQADLIERVSVSSDGAQGNDGSDGSRISGNGRYVAFASWASNLVAGDTNSW